MRQLDRRRDPRIDFVNEIYYEVNRSEILAVSTDVSRGGVFVQTMHPLLVGEQTKLRVRLDQSQKFYRAVGIVRHRLEWVGMGLEFTQLHPLADNLSTALLWYEDHSLLRSFNYCQADSWRMYKTKAAIKIISKNNPNPIFGFDLALGGA